MSKHLKTLCMVSIALNAMLFGIVLGEVSYYFTGYYITQGILHSGPEICAPKSPETLLPDAKRTLLNSTLTPAFEQTQKLRVQIDAAKREALRILQAEPFDEKAYRAQIQHILDLHAKNKHDVTDAVVKVAKQFTPKERAILADIVMASGTTGQTVRAK